MEIQIGDIQLGTIDLIAAAILILFLVRGLIKGFVSQLAGVVILVGGLAVARAAGPHARDYVSGILPDGHSPDLDIYVAYFVVFIVFMIVVAIVAKLLNNVIGALKLQSYDRFLGGLFGLGLGTFIVIVGLACSILFLPYIIEEATVKDHMSRAYSPRLAARAVTNLNPLFPEEIRDSLEEFAAELEKVSPSDTEEASGDQGSGDPGKAEPDDSGQGG